MDKNQTGFVPRYRTHINIQLLTTKIKSYKKADRYSVIFIDLKSAYNTANRNLLYNILREKEILDKDQIDLHENIYFKCNGKKYYFKNGLH